MNRNVTIAIMMMLVGVTLRLGANAIAWPSNYSFSGPRECSVWGIREAAINDIARGIFCVGGVLLIGALLIPAARQKQ